MKSKNLVGLSLIGLSLGTFAVGCGDSGDTGTGGGTGTGGATSTTTGVTVSGTGGGGTGGGSGDGNDTLMTATPMDESAMTPGVFAGQGDLDPADTDVDFWSFTGVAGPASIVTIAKPDTDGFADGYLDTVLTVFDSNGNQIAQNDDPFPRTSQDAALYTILPANGTYYVKVEEFCEFAGSGCPADYFTNLTDLTYIVGYSPLDPADNSIMDEHAEPNDTLANATAMEYEPVANMTGSYYLSLAYGDLGSGSDVDGIKFTIPADVNVTAGSRLNASFELPPPGKDGNGSGINPGLVQIIDPSNADAIMAEFDMSAEDATTGRASISAPLLADHEYLLKIAAGGASNLASADPFYFVLHGSGSGNPVETADVTNTVVATPETLTVSTGTTSYFVEGDILTVADVDHFSIAKQTGNLSVACGAQRSGSGLRAFKAEVLKGSDGSAITGGSATETATADLLISDLDVGAETSVIVKLSAGSQDGTVTGTYYRCGFHFAPPAP
jgi:hypothetical protein